MENKIKTSLFLPRELYREMRYKAVELDTNNTTIIIKALEKYLKGDE